MGGGETGPCGWLAVSSRLGRRPGTERLVSTRDRAATCAMDLRREPQRPVECCPRTGDGLLHFAVYVDRANSVTAVMTKVNARCIFGWQRVHGLHLGASILQRQTQHCSSLRGDTACRAPCTLHLHRGLEANDGLPRTMMQTRRALQQPGSPGRPSYLRPGASVAFTRTGTKYSPKSLLGQT